MSVNARGPNISRATYKAAISITIDDASGLSAGPEP